jgi:hypothetical protein
LRFLLGWPQVTDLGISFDKLATEFLKLPELRHFALGLVDGGRTWQRLGDGLAVRFVREPEIGSVARLTGLMAMAAWLATATRRVRDGARAKVAELSDPLRGRLTSLLKFGKGLRHINRPLLPSVAHTQGKMPQEKK